MNTIVAISLMTIGSVFNAIAPIILKRNKTEFKNIFNLINPYFLGGLFFYGLAYIVTLPPLKEGDVGMLYPIMALTYVWSYFLGVVYLKEKKSYQKLIGVGIIIIGIIILI